MDKITNGTQFQALTIIDITTKLFAIYRINKKNVSLLFVKYSSYRRNFK